jgi:hypothetical protein
MSRRRITVLLVLATLLGAATATAKDFEPGDLRVCNAAKCTAVFDRRALKIFSAFYYGEGEVSRAPAPRIGSAAFRLKLNASVAGIAATRRLDRVLVYGLNCGRFQRGVWYRLPRPAASAIRRVTAGLKPLHVSRQVPPSC